MVLNNKFGNVIINIKNINEALLATKHIATSIMLYDVIPMEIIDMNISGPQFQFLIVNEIQNNISIPLIVRIRIGNIDELKLLTKMGIKHFYEKNLISKPNSIKFNKKHYSSIYFMNKSSTLGDILENYSNGTHAIKITGDDIHDTIATIQNIYNDIELLKNNKHNYAFIKHKCIKYNLHYNTINKIIDIDKLPLPIYLSNINCLHDFEHIVKKEHLLKLIDGIIIENGIFNLKNVEKELDSIITMYRKSV